MPRRRKQVIPGLSPCCGLGQSDSFDQRPDQGHAREQERFPLRRGRATAAHRTAKPKPQLGQSCLDPENGYLSFRRPVSSKEHRGDPSRSHCSWTSTPMISDSRDSASWQTSGCSATALLSGQLPPRIKSCPFSFSTRADPPIASSASSALPTRVSRSHMADMLTKGIINQYPAKFK